MQKVDGNLSPHTIKRALKIEKRCRCVVSCCTVLSHVAQEIQEAALSSQVETETNVLMRKEAVYLLEPSHTAMHEAFEELG